MTEQMKIVSDGTAKGTKVLVDGKELKGIQTITICLDAQDIGYGEVVLTVRGVPVELEGRVNLEVEYEDMEPVEVPTFEDPAQLLPDSAYNRD